MKTEVEIRNEIERFKGIIKAIENENRKIEKNDWRREHHKQLIQRYRTDIIALSWVLENNLKEDN